MQLHLRECRLLVAKCWTQSGFRYRRILSHFDPVIISDQTHSAAGPSQPPTSSGVPIVGFSATFSRHDGLALGSVFERVVYHRDFLEMIDEKW